METTVYGYRVPEAGDKAKGASGWYQAMEFNWERISDHNHDGANSALLDFSNYTPFSDTIEAADWVVSGLGYKQTVTVPAGVSDINLYNVKFIFTAPAGRVGEIAYLNYDRLTATTYDVYCNDNTAAFTAIYR